MPKASTRFGLGPREPGTLEVFDRPRIDEHRFDSRRALQGERQAQAVNAGGFQTHASCGFAAGEQLEQAPMAGGRVRQSAGTFALAVAENRHDQFSGADIEAGEDLGRWFYGLFHGLVSL